MESIDSGKELTAAFIDLKQNKCGRRHEMRHLLINDCQCDKCRLNLDKDFDYSRLKDIITNQPARNLMPGTKPWFNWVNDNHYYMDIEMIDGLRQIFGEYNPDSTELIALCFVFFGKPSVHKNANIVALSYHKVLDLIDVTHGKEHPLYKMVSDSYLRFL